MAIKTEKSEEEKLLYNPKRWVRWAFFIGLIPVGILYNRNCNLIGAGRKGTIFLLLTVFYNFIIGIASAIYVDYSLLIVFIGAFGTLLITWYVAKRYYPVYKKAKKEKGLPRDRKDIGILVFSMIIFLFSAFAPFVITKYVMDRFIKETYIVVTVGDREIYIPKSVKWDEFKLEKIEDLESLKDKNFIEFK